MTDLPTFADVEDAARRLRGAAVLTPLLRSDALDEATGARVFVKAECLQRTGSFKFRGAYNRLSRLSRAQRRTGVAAFSSGNHAQGVAAAARMLGMPAVIVMPSDAPELKVRNTRDLGAEVIFYDRWTQSREAMAEAAARERGAILVPAFEDFHVMAGQGTLALEALAQLKAAGAAGADIVLSPVSGGGLMAGIGLVFAELSPAARLYVVEPQGHDDHAASLKAGRPVGVPPAPPGVQDALLAPMPGDMTFALNSRRLAGALAVSDEEALAAMAFAFLRLKIVLEPGGAAGLAALLSGRVDARGATVLVVASGGNVDPAMFVRALSA